MKRGEFREKLLGKTLDPFSAESRKHVALVVAMRILPWILALSGLAVIAPASGQVVVGGGVGYGYWMVPVPVVPLYAYPYPYGGYSFPDPLRFEDGLPSCYRVGRCSLRDIEFFRDRPHRLERLAPAVPGANPPADYGASPWGFGYVPPTPEENIQPEYRGASQPRAEFEESGQPIAPAAGGRR